MLQAPSLRQAPTPRTITTAHLAQTMSLMELSAFELSEKIEAELSKNPALELREEKRCPTCRNPLHGTTPCPRCSNPHKQTSEEPIVFVSPREDFHMPGRSKYDETPDDNLNRSYEELSTYVLRQIAPELQPADRGLAAHILTTINEDGLLDTPLSEVARYHHIPISKVAVVLDLIQHADPVGVGSPSPKEALLVQLEVLSETIPIPPYAAQAIREGLDLLSRHQYAELGKEIGISTSQARQLSQWISDNLNPFPGRAYWGEVHQGSSKPTITFSFPDVIISRHNHTPDSPLLVEVVAPFSGSLQVNPMFREYIHQAPPEKAEEWKEDLEKADLLVKCIQQRANTIVRLVKRLVILQKDFILHGDGHLRPFTRAALAKELELHESTISRAVSSKIVQLPNGHLIPLDKFFDRSLHVRTAIKQLIENEVKPLSDSDIVSLLDEQGYCVARRTVAKYRAMEGILPSHLRQLHPVIEVA